MSDLSEVIRLGAANPWFYIPSAVLLGALHGLEPGHSKSMMAAFLVAVKGTVGQAVMLGLAAAFSHSLVVWVLAVAGLSMGRALLVAEVEPYLMLASAAMVGLLAVWMLAKVRAVESHNHGACGCGHHHGEVAAREKGKPISTWQIIGVGLSGGLLPCPASLAVLLACLQLQQVTLGVAMVAAFSVGLALTLVGAGVAAAYGMRHAEKRWGGRFERVVQLAPVASAVVMLAVAAALAWHAGWALMA